MGIFDNTPPDPQSDNQGSSGFPGVGATLANFHGGSGLLGLITSFAQQSQREKLSNSLMPQTNLQPAAGDTTGGANNLPTGQNQPNQASPTATAQNGPPTLENFIKNQEGYKSNAYQDGNQYSVGWGTKANSPDETIDPATAQSRLTQELNAARQQVNQFAPNAPQGVKDALTDLQYNTGSKWQTAGLGQAIQRGDYAAAKPIFLQYNQVDGKFNSGVAARRVAASTWFDNPLPSSIPAANGNAPPVGGPNIPPPVPGAQTPGGGAPPMQPPPGAIFRGMPPPGAIPQPGTPAAPAPTISPVQATVAALRPQNAPPGGAPAPARPPIMPVASQQPQGGQPAPIQRPAPGLPPTQNNVPVASTTGQPTAPPPSSPGAPRQGIFIDPNLLPKQQLYSAAQVHAVLMNPQATPAQQQALLENYTTQMQPKTVPLGEFGSISYNPANPTKQTFIPNIKWTTEKGYGGVETQVPNYGTPQGTFVRGQVGSGSPPTPGGPQPANPNNFSNPADLPGGVTGGAAMQQDIQRQAAAKSAETSATASATAAQRVYQGSQGLGSTGAKIANVADGLLPIVQDPNWSSGGLPETRLALARLANSLNMPSTAPAKEVVQRGLGLIKSYWQDGMKSNTDVLGDQARLFQSEITSINPIIGDLSETNQGLASGLQTISKLGNHWKGLADDVDAQVDKLPGQIPDRSINKFIRDNEANFHLITPEILPKTPNTPTQTQTVGGKTYYQIGTKWFDNPEGK